MDLLLRRVSADDPRGMVGVEALTDPLVLLIDLLACYRLARLVVKDSLLQEVRWWILNRWPSALTEFPEAIVSFAALDEGGEPTYPHLESGTGVFKSNKVDDDGDPIWLPIKTYKFTEYLECVYCASVPVAFGVLALRIWWDWWRYPALGLALAGGVALIFSKLDNE